MKTTETAKLIRKELKGVFPKQKFSVRKRSVGAIDVSWMDGVSQDKVKPILQKHEWFQRDQATQEILSGGNTFVFAERSVSSKNKEKIKKKLLKGYNWNEKKLDWERQQILQREVWEKLNKTDF
jgi:hypothetical protein